MITSAQRRVELRLFVAWLIGQHVRLGAANGPDPHDATRLLVVAISETDAQALIERYVSELDAAGRGGAG